VFVNGDLGTANWISLAVNEASPPAGLASSTPEGALNLFLVQTADLLYTGPGRPVLAEVTRERDEFGYWHFRLAQRFEGIPVYGGEATIHVRQTANGQYYVYAAAARVLAVEQLSGRGLLPEPVVEATVRERLAGRGAPATRAVQRWIVGVEGQYVVAWEVAFGDSASVWQGTAAARAFVREDNGTPLAYIWGQQSATRSAAAPGANSLLDRLESIEPVTGALETALSPGSGVDVFGRSQTFGSTAAGGTFQLVDRTHTGASEIRVYNNGGQDTPVPNEAFLSTDSDDTWDLQAQRQDVSGAVNGGRVIDYWYQTHARQGMRNDGGILRVLVNSGSGVNAFYDGTNFTIRFRSGGSDTINGAPSQVLPLVGAQDVVFHEFQHGVNDAEDASDNDMNFDASAIDEGLSDYFGVSYTGSSCLMDTVITSPARVPQGDAGDPTPPGCFRDIEPDVSIYSSTATEGTRHDRGLVAASALWDARKLVDHTLYNRIVYRAIQFYLPSAPDFLLVREAVVQAAKDLERNNTVPPAVRPSRYTEEEFYQNDVGGPAIIVTLSWNPAFGGRWEADIQGPPNLAFNGQMQAGTGVNNDESIATVTDVADNDPQFTIGADGTLHFLPGQLGWYNLRAHYPGDGHNHAVRVRVAAQSALGGYLNYHDSDSGQDPLEPRRVATREAGTPSSFFLSQLVAGHGDEAELRVIPGRGQEPSAGARATVERSGITALRFGVPAGPDGRPQRVRITVFDLAGRVVRHAVDEEYAPGTHEWQWDLLSDSGRRVPPGAYVAIMVADGFRTRRVLIVR
jgi:thermolysin